MRQSPDECARSRVLPPLPGLRRHPVVACAGGMAHASVGEDRS